MRTSVEPELPGEEEPTQPEYTPNRWEYQRRSPVPELVPGLPPPAVQPPPFKPRSRTIKHVDPLPQTRDALFPVGNELLIRGVLDKGKPLEDPVIAVREFVDSMCDSDPELASFAINVLPFKFGSRDPTTSCYLALDWSEENPRDISVPRFDLLDLWRATLLVHRPQWEVVWAPQKRGTDKRMWIRFPSLKADPNVDSYPDKILDWAKKENILAVSCFNTGGGSILTLGNPEQVDDLLRQRDVTIESIRKSPIQILSSRQIEIEHAFELIVTGIREYDHRIQEYLTSWFSHAYKDESNESLITSSRVPSKDANAFVFTMADWKATVRVLQDHKKFKAELNPPCPPAASLPLQ
jgi:hypothetical protein